MTPDGPTNADLGIEANAVTAVAPELDISADTVIDATGCLVGPGFVDLHVHLRDPGQTWKEDLETGSRAAAAGGYTGVVAMPNTDPPLDNPGAIRDVIERGRQIGLMDVAVAAALTQGREGTEATDVTALYAAGARIFSDDGDSVEDSALLKDQMLLISRLPGAVVSQHAEDTTLTLGGHMHEGETAKMHRLGQLPSSAESDVVARDLKLAEETGCRYHCQHVSAAATVDLIREAKKRGLHITAEVTPHHLYFTDEDLAVLDTNLKMYPPLRSEADRQSLVTALQDGTIDAVATDHAPHSQSEKDVGFEEAPRGVIGLETAASVAWSVIEQPVRFFEIMSAKPADIAGMATQGLWLRAGGPANVVVFDPNENWLPTGFASRSVNSPFLGEKLSGRVQATIYQGKMTYQLDETDD